MDQFTRIHIKGFRRLYDVDLRLKPLNVLIGANGCGKTSLLDVFSLLSASANGALNRTMHDMGGINANLSASNQSGEKNAVQIQFELEKDFVIFDHLRYEISLDPIGVSYLIRTESLARYSNPSKPEPSKLIAAGNGSAYYLDPHTSKLVSPDWNFNWMESALSQVPVRYETPEIFREELSSSTHYHVLDVSNRAPVRLPQQVGEARLPGRDGEDLISCLYWMREADSDRFETIEDTLRVAFPGFDRLNFPPVASGMLAMTWKEKEFTRPFYTHELSEGTLRFLWLVTLLYSPGLTEVTLIDEPEVSLHPELLSVLADCLRDASLRTQLIVATHADRLVRFLNPDEVVAMDIEDGYTIATRADELELDEWLKDYTLDQLWDHGRVGGRP